MITVDTKGCTRLVLLTNRWAIKTPNFLAPRAHFVKGFTNNYDEWKYTKDWKDFPDLYDLINPTVFCCLFGLISIQRRLKPLEQHLTEEQHKTFSVLTSDIKKQNFGVTESGKVLCVDYA